MNIKLLKPIIIALGFITLSATSLFGQSATTSAINGTVRDNDGIAVSSANVIALHEPSGTTYRTVTRAGGYFSLSGLRPGGPYTVSVSGSGFKTSTVSDLSLSLSATTPLTISVTSNVVELEAFTVSANDFSAIPVGQIGVRSTLDTDVVVSIPQTEGSINDFARLNPLVAVTEEDRNELSAAGQNSRFNSISIDGVRVNDQFGLDSSGSVSLISPIPWEAVSQVNVEVFPIDVRLSGFTGALVNVVSKSGSNDFSGSFYTRYEDDQYRGSSVLNDTNPLFRQFTWGLSLGGPIIKDKLFFFVNYEEFERTLEPPSTSFIPDPAAVQQVIDYGNSLGVDFGSFAPPAAVKLETESLLINLDWNITDMHRARYSYRGQDGVSPNFGNYDDFGETALSSNFYTQERSEDYHTVQFFSDWTSNFSTEFRLSLGEYRQPTTFDTALPQIEIDMFPDNAGDDDAGELFLGTERFRHANNLEWDIFSLYGAGTYYMGNHEITFGFDYEITEFSNLFLSDSLGNFTFRTLDDFLNDQPQFPGFRNTGIIGQDPIATPELGVFSLFVQDRWAVNDQLTILAGIRADNTISGNEPTAAQGFEEAFGFANNGSIDGELLVTPRVGFTYEILQDWIPDGDRMQIRGGIGLLNGRTPSVWFSNAFTNNGETSGSISLGNSLEAYLSSFNPDDSPIFVDRQQSTPTVDVLPDGLKLPAVWRQNIAIDYEYSALDLVFTIEALFSQTQEGLYVTNANQPVVGTGPDGREIYQDFGVTTAYRDVFVLQNTDEGRTQNLVLGVERPNRGEGWYGELSVNFGESRDVNPFTSSRAVSNWGNRAGFNFNQPELGVSNFEIKERWLGIIGYNLNWAEGFRTRATLIWDGRTGRPFSYTFDGDVNGDGQNNNDLIYIPTGANDPNVVFAPGFDTEGFLSFLDRTGLSQHAGGPAPRNSHNNPWVHRWDLKLTQEIPFKFTERSQIELFVTIRNLGNLLNDEWGLTQEVGFPFTARIIDADVDGNQFIFNEFDDDNGRILVNRTRSRWGVQFGAKVEF